jgi:RNA polymerase subunit RPABC4/transcription elongation factor Spt4
MSKNVIFFLLLAAACLAWTCPECGNVNQNDQEYCTNCGAERPEGAEMVAPTVEVETEEVSEPTVEAGGHEEPEEYGEPLCPNCGEPVEEGWTTCPHCGYKLVEIPVEPLGTVMFAPRVGVLMDFDLFLFDFGGSLGFNVAEREYISFLFSIATYDYVGIKFTVTEILAGFKQIFPAENGTCFSAGAYVGPLIVTGDSDSDSASSAVFLLSSRLGVDFELSPMSFFELEFGFSYALGQASGILLNLGPSLVFTF